MSGGWAGRQGLYCTEKGRHIILNWQQIIEMKTCFSTAPWSDQSAESLSELSLSAHNDLFLIVFKAALSVPTLHMSDTNPEVIVGEGFH